MDNLLGIDATGMSGESLFLLLNKFELEFKHLKSNKIECYKDLSQLDLKADCTVTDLFEALPSNCYAQFELTRDNINLSTKLFKRSPSVVPAVLIVGKGSLRATFRLVTELGTWYRYVYGSAKYDTGWYGVSSSQYVYVDTDMVKSVQDFNHAGKYYLNRTVTAGMSDFPTDWDCFLEISKFRSTHSKYVCTSILADAPTWTRVVSSTVDSGWVKR